VTAVCCAAPWRETAASAINSRNTARHRELTHLTENAGHETAEQERYRIKITLQCSLHFFSKQRKNTSQRVNANYEKKQLIVAIGLESNRWSNKLWRSKLCKI